MPQLVEVSTTRNDDDVTFVEFVSSDDNSAEEKGKEVDEEHPHSTNNYQAVTMQSSTDLGPQILDVYSLSNDNDQMSDTWVQQNADENYRDLLSRVEILEQDRLKDRRKIESLRTYMRVVERQRSKQINALRKQVVQLQRQRMIERQNIAKGNESARKSTAVSSSDQREMPVEADSHSGTVSETVVPNRLAFPECEVVIKEEVGTCEPRDDEEYSVRSRSASNSPIPQIPSDVKDFIAHWKELMTNNSFSQEDVMKWSMSRFHIVTPWTISQFLNMKLDEENSRNIMNALQEFLDGFRPVMPQQLPEDIQDLIDQINKKMKKYHFDSADVVAWTKDHVNIQLDPGDVGLCLKKELGHEDSRNILEILGRFLKSQTAPKRREKPPRRPLTDPSRLRRFSPKKRFTPLQVATMNEAFRRIPYPHRDDYERLALQLQTTTGRIRTWFFNRRRQVNRLTKEQLNGSVNVAM